MCCVYLYLLQKDTCTVAISIECPISCEKLEEIATVQVTFCNKYVNKTRLPGAI